MPLPAAVPAIVAGAGALFNFLGNRNSDPNRKRDQRASQREGVAQAARARMIEGILKGYGLESLIDPGMMKNLTTPVPGAVSARPSWANFAGGILSQAAPFMGGGAPGAAGGAGAASFMPGPGGMSFPPITQSAMQNLSQSPMPTPVGDDDIYGNGGYY